MLPGFQQYLVDKGFKRTYQQFKEVKENYDSLFVSSYGPTHYEFSFESVFKCWYGLAEMHKPPVMYLGSNKMKIIQNSKNMRTQEDGYRILFNKCHHDKFDEIYNVLMTEEKYFEIDCTNEKDIKINVS